MNDATATRVATSLELLNGKATDLTRALHEIQLVLVRIEALLRHTAPTNSKK